MFDNWTLTVVCSLALTTGFFALTQTAASQGEESSDPDEEYASVFCGPEGITLRWYSNEIENVIDGEAKDCRVDNRVRAVWYRDAQSNLKVYDHVTGDSTVVVDGLPTEIDYGVAYYNLHLAPKPGTWIYLINPTTPGTKTTVRGGAMRSSSSLTETDIRNETSILAKQKLDEFAKRALQTAPARKCEAGIFADCEHRSRLDDPPERVEGVPGAPCSRNRCGRTEVVPHTRYLLVTTKFECEDKCHATEKLYDPETGAFLDPRSGSEFDDPAEAPVWQGGYFSPDGQFLLQGGAIKKVGEGTLVEVDEGSGAGWLLGLD